MGYSLIHGDATTLPLADGSVSLVVTSPPYWALRSYRDGDEHYDGQLGSESSPYGFLVNLWRVMDELWRVLRDDGNVWVNLGDKYAGSGGHNNAGLSGGPAQLQGRTQRATDFVATRRQAPDRYNQNTGNLRPKSRMLLPHLFAAGCEYRWLRHAVEMEAGFQRTHNPPQWILRMDAVWNKPNGLPESVTDRVRASHEYLFHLVKSERYYAAIDEVREEHLHGGWGSSWDDRKAKGNPTYSPDNGHVGAMGHDNRMAGNPLGKVPGSVWTIATEPLVVPDHLPKHFAAFPSELPRRIILGWSPPGICTACGEGRRPVSQSEITGDRGGRQFNPSSGNIGYLGKERRTTITGYACACPTPDAPATPATVLDPFSGTGTTPIAAAAFGRHGVGVDLSWDYHRIARWRDRDGALRAKALEVARPPKQADGQMSLLDT